MARARTKPLLERDVDRALVRYAKRRGVRVVPKIHAVSRRGFPDRLFLATGGRVLFVEVKRPGGRPSRLQAQTLTRLRALGFRAEVVDDVAAGQRLLDDWLAT